MKAKKRRRFVVEIDEEFVEGYYTNREVCRYIKEAVVTYAKCGDPDERLFDLDDGNVVVRHLKDT